MKLPDELKFPQLQAAVTKMLDDPQPMVDIYEFGVYNAVSLFRLIKILNRYSIDYRKIYGIDSFQGLPKEDESVDYFVKFGEGAYKSKFTPEAIKARARNTNKLEVIERWFKDLNKEDVIHYNMFPAKFVHMDVDLYTSCYDALKFMFENKLIVKSSLISYDEFISIDGWAGEQRAHDEIMSEYGCKCEEVWHFIYADKQFGTKIRQSLFEVISL